MAGRAADVEPADDPAAHDVHDNDSLQPRVGDERVLPVERRGGIAGLLEVLQNSAHPERRPVDQADGPVGRVGDDCGLLHALDAAGPGKSRNLAKPSAGRQVERDDVGLEVGSDEGDRCPTKTPRQSLGSDREGGSGDNELTPVHSAPTAAGPWEVPHDPSRGTRIEPGCGRRALPDRGPQE